MAGDFCWKEDNPLPDYRVHDEGIRRTFPSTSLSPKETDSRESVSQTSLTRKGSNVSQTTSYHQDRSVSEIETNFSEHFLPLDVESTSSEDEHLLTSSEFCYPEVKTPIGSITHVLMYRDSSSPSPQETPTLHSTSNEDLTPSDVFLCNQDITEARINDRTNNSENNNDTMHETISSEYHGRKQKNIRQLTPASSSGLDINNKLKGRLGFPSCGSNVSTYISEDLPSSHQLVINEPSSAIDTTIEDYEESQSTSINQVENELFISKTSLKLGAFTSQSSFDTNNICFSMGSNKGLEEPDSSISKKTIKIGKSEEVRCLESDIDSSIYCDSAIQNEAQIFANNILDDMNNCELNFDSLDEIKSNAMFDSAKSSDIFIESATEDSIVIDNFAFSRQDNFFQKPNNLYNLQEDGTKNDQIYCDNSVEQQDQNTHKLCPKLSNELSLIEEVTEYSSLSTIKSVDTPRNLVRDLPSSIKCKDEIQYLDCNLKNKSSLKSVPFKNMQLQTNKGQDRQGLPLKEVKKRKSHIPRILNPISPRDTTYLSPRVNTTIAGSTKQPNKNLHQRFKDTCGRDSPLPSKSNPSTPRIDHKYDVSRVNVLNKDIDNKVTGTQFTQNKPKIVSKRFIRSSPPRESNRGVNVQNSIQTPIQTKTGLTVTIPNKEPESELSKQQGLSRCNSSASLLLRSNRSPTPLGNHLLDRTKSLSSGSLVSRGTKRKKYDHVQSKVAQYIREVKSIPKKDNLDKELSKSCSNLIVGSSFSFVTDSARPRTTEGSKDRTQQKEITNEDDLSKINNPMPGPKLIQRQVLMLKKNKSKSETNLRAADLFRTPSEMSKSSSSVAFRNIDKLIDCSDPEDYINPAEDPSTVNIWPEDLVELVMKERQGKQEARKVLTELQANYDQLLQKFAAAENALDKVRFGVKPPPDSGEREEAFNLARAVAEKIANFEVEERRGWQGDEFDEWLVNLKREDIRFEHVLEETKSPSELTEEKLSDIKHHGDKILVKAASLEMAVNRGTVDLSEAGAGIEALTDSLKKMICHQIEAGNSDTVMLLSDVSQRLEGIQLRLVPNKDDPLQSPALQAAIAKVSLWQKSLPSCPPPPTGIPSCYGSLPTSPTPSHRSSPDLAPVTAIVKPPVSLGTQDMDSGCPGSDRSTLFLSGGLLQSRGLSPSSKSKSRENISSTPLYNLEEEHVDICSVTSARSSSIIQRSVVTPKQRSNYLLEGENIECSNVILKSPIGNITSELLMTPRPIITPRDIVSCNNQYVTSLTIERGIKLSPNAKAEQRKRQTTGDTQYREIFRHCKANLEGTFYSPDLKRTGSLGNSGIITSTPKHLKQRVLPENQMVRSMGINDLQAVSKGEIVTAVDISSDDEDDKVLTENHPSQIQDLSDAEYIDYLDHLNILPENYYEVEKELHKSKLLSTPKKTPNRCLFPSQEGDTTGANGGPQSQLLAEEIDNEILELRNFFEDHREEMMSLLHGGHSDLAGFQNSSLTMHADKDQEEKKKSMSMVQLKRSQNGNQRSSPELPNPNAVPPYLLDPPHSHWFPQLHSEEQFSSGGRMNSSLPNWRATYESESDVVPDKTLKLRKLEFEKRRLRKEGRRSRRLAGNGMKSFSQSNSQTSVPDQASISSFFPLLNSNHNNIKDSPNSTSTSLPFFGLEGTSFQPSNDIPGNVSRSALEETETESCYGMKNMDNMLDRRCPAIPKLNLEDICSDVTAPSHSVDLSFSHTTSPHKRLSVENPLDLFQLERKEIQNQTSDISRLSQRSVGCDTKDLMNRSSLNNKQLPTSTQTTPGRCTNNCHLSTTPSTPLGKSLTLLDQDQTCSVERILQCARGPVIINQTNCEHKCSTKAGNLQNHQLDKKHSEGKPKRNSKKKGKKSSKDLNDLMTSLDAANTLALRLKKRSEDMLGILGQELSHIPSSKK